MKGDWLKYIRQLPRERPDDLHITVTTGGEKIKLCEGEEADIGLYYARIERIYRRGLPGELSVLAIGRLSAVLTKGMVIESVRHIRKMMIT